MWVVLLPLAECNQEVLAVSGDILRSVLDDGRLALAQLFGQFRHVLFGVRLLQLHEDLLQEAGLLTIGILLLNDYGFGYGSLDLGSWFWLLGFFIHDALQQFLADLCHFVVVVGAVGTLGLEEGELGLVLFALDEDLLEFGAVVGHVLSSLFE